MKSRDYRDVMVLDKVRPRKRKGDVFSFKSLYEELQELFLRRSSIFLLTIELVHEIKPGFKFSGVLWLRPKPTST